MRILFSAVPGAGHVNPMLPLAREAQAAGHQIALLTGTEMVGKIDDGIPVLTAGPPIEVMFAEAARRVGGPATPGGTAPLSRDLEIELFTGTRIDLTAPEALTVAEQWRPDLVVSEYTDTIGPLSAAHVGVPWARMAFGPAMDDESVAEVARNVAPRYAERGLTPTAPIAYIDPCPPSLQRPGWRSGPHRIALRPQPHQANGPSSAVPQFPGVPQRPLVVITLGTIFGNTTMLRAMVESLEPIGVNVISTLGGQFDSTAMDLEGAWVKLVDYVPLARLLDGVRAVVTVGGAGTTLGTLERGIPLVMFPQAADHPRNVAAATRAGAAIEIHDPAEVGAAVARILADPSFTERAQAVAGEMQAMKTTPEVLAELLSSAR
jgi:UDP:flavonoid glycosyltransferase YjiC (YdhE family)